MIDLLDNQASIVWMHAILMFSNYTVSLPAKSREFDYLGDRSPLFFNTVILIAKGKIENIIKDGISDSDVFVVDISIKPSNMIQVYLDKPGGIPLETCVKFSKLIESSLDRENEDFELQVSSPGLNEAFRVPQQYLKNIGKSIKVIGVDGEKYKGTIKSADEAGIDMEAEIRVKLAGSKKKTTDIKSVRLEYKDIKTAKVNLEF